MPAKSPPPVFFFDADMESVELHDFAGGRVAVCSRRSPDKSSANEDSLALIEVDETTGVIAVADGLGGMPGGEQASRVALVELSREITNTSRESPRWLREAILTGIDRANDAVRKLNAGATTLAIAEVTTGAARPFHVGDSLIVLCGQRGRLKHEALAHSPVAYARHAGFLDEEEAMSHEARNLIDNVVGSDEMRVEIGPQLELAPLDTLVLATDGLCDNLYVAEIVESVCAGDLETVSSDLLNACRARMSASGGEHPSKADDLTFAIFRPG